MTKIISDTSTLYDAKEAKQNGFTVIPLIVTIDGKSYRELEEIKAPEFLDLVQQGHIPSSSQPPIGEVLEAFESTDEEILNISMADGLSGTYQSACMAKQQCEKENVHVINSATLCGPHRHLVEKAVAYAKEGKGALEIIDLLQDSIHHSQSFLIPQDFDFLKRGGRCTAMAAKIGGILKFVPVMTLTEDCKHLEKHHLARTFKKALASVKESFVNFGVNKDYIISISHALNNDQTQTTIQYFKDAFPETEIQVFELSPAFITQGGPGCVAIQCIKR